MLQRSPTYMVARPAEDAVANGLRKHLPAQLAYQIIRWRNVLLGMFFFNQFRKYPEKAKQRLIEMVRGQLNPGYDVETHFTPRYNPWDQRLCLVPDADMFKALNDGSASIVTDQIEHFTPDGIALQSGQTLPADIVVSATGLKLVVAGELEVSVDGRPVRWADTMSYKGMMFSEHHAVEAGRLLRPAPDRPHRRRAAVARFQLGLCAARHVRVPAPGRQEALAALSELSARHVVAALRQDRRWCADLRPQGGGRCAFSG